MTDQRRGKRLALTGAVLQMVLCVAMLGVWMGTRSDAALASMWFLVAGVPLWLMAAILFYCRQLAAREAQEIEEIAAQGGAQGAIFERSEALEQRPAARRVAWAEKWAAPAFTLAWTALQIVTAVLVGQGLLASTMPKVYNPGEGAVFLLVVAMAAFLFSYYCLGMAREEQWRLHRATGSYLLVSSLLIGASAVGMLLAYWRQYFRPDDFIAYAVPVLQLLLSFELVLNFVLDLYRPRLPDQEHRFSFDSRLFNMLAEPGKVGHSIAETINYQFGFEVSKTWFYQLISRATVWLLLTGVAILVALSSVMVVRDGETYVVRRLGRFADEPATVGPGLHFKLPWPLETAERFETGGVQQVLLGAGERTDDEIRSMDYIGRLEVLDWSKEHGEHEELDFLIAFPPRKQEDPPVHIIKLVVLVQYAIRDVYQYGYRFVEPRKALECLAYRELTQYFATATLDSPVAESAKDRPQAIMTFGRKAATEELKKRVQAQADKYQMGVDITTVAFVGVHPPPTAAGEFENVLKAQRAIEQKRFEAEADAARVLTRQAGNPAAALQLALAIQKLEELKDLNGLRNDGNQFRAQQQRYLRGVSERVEILLAEVEQERREGRLHAEGPAGGAVASAEQLTDKQALLKSYEEYGRALAAISAPADLSAQMAQAGAVADKLFDQATGASAAEVYKAKGYRWGQEMAGRGEWEAFRAALPAYLASPVVYEWDRWVEMWEEVLPTLYKYVLATDRKNVEVRFDWTRSPSMLESLPQTPAGKEAKKP